MNTKSLRQKVLDLAIHGKLVPQNPNDESATVLLEKIRAEKAEKIKNGLPAGRRGELKADKKDSFIFVGSDKRHYEQFADGTVKDIEDEIPFNIPEGWAWCRLKEVCTVFGRIGFRGYTRDDLVEKGNGAITLSPSNLINMKLDLTDCTYISWPKYEESPEIQLDINDIVVVKTGSSYGKTSLVDNLTEKTTLNPQLMVLKERKCNSKYLCYFLNTQYMWKHFEDLVNGTAIPTFSQEKFGMKLFPLPPASEQEKIVSRIELIFDKIDLLENDKENLDTIIKQTKSKILDLAIHGKLVPQDPNDEPADQLLKRIATSDYRPYEKVEDEIDYEIPKNWCLCKIKDVCSVIMGQSPAGEAVSDDKNGMEFHQGKICFGEKYLEESSSFTKHITKIAPKDSVLLCVRAPVGIVNITEREICIGRGLCAVIPKYEINSDFWFYWLQSLQSDFEQKATGTTFRAISVDVIKNQFVAIPPHEEQNRIVNKINELYEQLDKIVLNLV